MACLGDTLGPGNGAPSVQAYSPNWAFGWRLPGPFCLRAGVGSHLTRLSGPRLRLTTPVRSLYFNLAVPKRLIPLCPNVKLGHRLTLHPEAPPSLLDYQRQRASFAVVFIPRRLLRCHYVLFLGPRYVFSKPGLVEENGVRDVGRRCRQLITDLIVSRVIHERQ